MMNVFYELYQSLPRGGPGSNKCTKKAYRILGIVPDNPKILDIGCGKGMQTLELVRISNGHVIALDNHQPFLDELEENAKKADLDGRIETHLGSMFSLDFEENCFDVLWSEGAIYIIGFEKGLTEWRKLLKPNGYIAVSELSWFKPNPPSEVWNFWKAEYPKIKSIEENLEIIEKTGYQNLGHFKLPDEVWWESLYTSMEQKLGILKKKYMGDPKSIEVLDNEYMEIEFFRKYSEWYGYLFYVMQRMD
jgi:ubiquinone/menaquinone biosynthesis C-methylase UbiE